MNERGIKLRFVIGAFVIMTALTGLGSRLAFLHVLQFDPEIDRSFKKPIIAGRGNIYDQRGKDNIMALNLAVNDVCADPMVIVESDKIDYVSQHLADSMGLDVELLKKRLSDKQRRFAYVKRFVPEPESAAYGELPGIFLRENTVRYYPHRSLMCHVLGFVNHEATGCSGVEQQMNRYLKGTAGLVESRVDGLRRELYWQRDRWVPALKGSDVFLTLDQNVQYIAEKALDGTIEKHNAKAAWAIVQRVKTGQIIAMVSRPAFDLNEFRTSDKNAWLNRSIGNVYEPGSTFKVVSLAAAIDRGVVSPTDEFDCENGAWFYGKRILHDYHSYDRLNVADILKKSSNIGTAKIALRLGDKDLYRYLEQFGIGRKLGIDLPGEEMGILNPVSRWSKISSTRIAIGQGVAVTSLQMLGAVCAIGNDGYLMRPYVVERISRKSGEPIVENKPNVISRAVSYETSRTMRGLMARVTENGGTGRRARVEGYTVAGKTGTAQKAVAGGYSSEAYIASFVGFAPAEDPRIGVIVVVDEPQPLHTGGQVAAPAFQQILADTLRYLDVAPEDESVSVARVGF